MTGSDVLVALVLLTLAAAVTLLFAMLAEVNARLPPSDRSAVTMPTMLEEAKLGASPSEWPPMLSRIGHDDMDALLLVLSPSCSACESVGSQLSSQLGKDELPSTNLAVVVPCSSETIGYDFVRRHGLDRSVAYVDVGGEWISTSFGVQTSPAALRIRDGILESAVVFNALSTLETLETGIKEVHP